jgi:heavy metal sensor kinase
MANSEAVLTDGVNLARFEAEMARVRTAFLAGMPAALLGIALGSWLVSRRALRSVESLAQAAEGVTASTLDQRIPDAGAETEFARLIRVFNHMLDRLERSFRQAMRFSADAAHELKTPLTILQGEIEQALQEAPPGSPQQQTLNDLLEEVQRLKSIVRKLLLLAQADAGQLRLAPEAVDLSQAVVALCDDTEALASHLSVRRDIVPDIQVQADPDLLAQVLQNLSTNAVKYNQEGGWIEFRLRPASRSVALTVSNSGPEIPAGDHDRVFERFYRADPARSRTRADGTGLGLSLSREIARAHGGELVLEQSRDGMTSFVLRLPLGG